MRPVRYRVAASLDGFIAGPNGEIDWIVPEPTVDFGAVYAQFDTVLLGRRTYELTRQPGAPPWPAGWKIYVFSRTLDPSAHPDVRIVRDDAAATVAALRAESGRDIWLFGGGDLCASLLAAGCVDTIEVALIPVVLGSGTPLVGAVPRSRLTLTRSKVYPSGIVGLSYDVAGVAG
jgi:dihydrofolate reductase